MPIFFIVLVIPLGTSGTPLPLVEYRYTNSAGALYIAGIVGLHIPAL